jgi:hypothetical protein
MAAIPAVSPTFVVSTATAPARPAEERASFALRITILRIAASPRGAGETISP